MWVYSICIWVYFTCIVFKPLQQLDKGVMLPINQHPWFRTCAFFFFFKLYLFVYLFLAALVLRCWALAFSSCGEQGLLERQCTGMSSRWFLFLCGWAWGCAGLLVPLHVESSGTRDWTRVPCLGRQTQPWATRGVWLVSSWLTFLAVYPTWLHGPTLPNS